MSDVIDNDGFLLTRGLQSSFDPGGEVQWKNQWRGLANAKVLQERAFLSESVSGEKISVNMLVSNGQLRTSRQNLTKNSGRFLLDSCCEEAVDRCANSLSRDRTDNFP
jgi:hypothetical protein